MRSLCARDVIFLSSYPTEMDALAVVPGDFFTLDGHRHADDADAAGAAVGMGMGCM
jgi:hypothetical protein